MISVNMGISPSKKARSWHVKAQLGCHDFCILQRNGHWSIFSGGSYFGRYVSVERALPLAIRVARDAARAGIGCRVVLMAEDGSGKVLWSGDQVSSLADISR